MSVDVYYAFDAENEFGAGTAPSILTRDQAGVVILSGI